MNRSINLRFPVIVLVLFLYANTTYAQSWELLNIPSKSEISDIVIENDTIYVVSKEAGGLFKKSINSSTWSYSQISEGEGAFTHGITGTLSFSISESGMYYAGGGGFITGDGMVYDQFFISEDYGKTWASYRNGLEKVGLIKDIWHDANGELFIGSASGVYKFRTEENSFVRVLDVVAASMLFQQNDTLLAGSRQGLSFSTDHGESWEGKGSDTLNIIAITSSEDGFFIGTNAGLYRANDLNQDWIEVEDFTRTSVNALLSLQNKLIVGTDSGAYSISTDGVETASVFPELKKSRITKLESYKGVIYVGSEVGLFACDMQSECVYAGIPIGRIRTLAFQGDDTLLVSSSDRIERFFALEEEWDTLSIPIDARKIIPVDKDNLFAISSHQFYRCSYVAPCDSSRVDPDNTLFSLDRSSTGDLFILTTTKVLQSGDNGMSWEPIFTFADRKRGYRSPLFSISDSLLFIEAGEQGLVKYSIADQTSEVVGFENDGVNAYYITGSGTIYVSAYYSIHKSTDLGNTWATLLRSSDLSDSDIIIDVLYDEVKEKLYAITSEGRVYVSNNDGKNWGINNELFPTRMEDNEIAPDGRLYLGTDEAGIFVNTKIIDPPITINNEPSISVPNAFTLYQNYPNPFNPSTTVSFELNKPSEVQIQVYNVFGQRVLTQNLGRLQSGLHSEQLNMSTFASGMYLLKLKANEYAQSIKITLIK